MKVCGECKRNGGKCEHADFKQDYPSDDDGELTGERMEEVEKVETECDDHRAELQMNAAAGLLSSSESE